MTSASAPADGPGEPENVRGLWWRGLLVGAFGGAVVGFVDALFSIWSGNELVGYAEAWDVVVFYAAFCAPVGLLVSFAARRFEWPRRALALLVAVGGALFFAAGWSNVNLLPSFLSWTSLLVDAALVAGALLWFRRAYNGPGEDEIRWVRWMVAACGSAAIALGLGLAAEDGDGPDVLARAPTDAVKPNVLVYVADTLRADHLGAYGYERPTSPEIDAFAADATLFRDCRSTTSWTKPAVASLMTSLYPTTHACVQQREVLVPDAETLAEVFRSAGWRTGAFSANPFVAPEFGLGQGFERFDRPQPSVVANGTLLGKALFMTRLMSLVGVPFGVGEHTGADCRDLHTAALGWIESTGDDPWFAYVHAMEPHLPYDPPREDAEAFGFPAGEEYDRPPAYNGILPFQKAPEPDVGVRERLVAQYDGEVRDLSRGFGELLAALRARGDMERTIVVFLSDHGEEFHEHGGWTHGHSLHPEVLRVPLIVRVPDAVEGGAAGRGRRVGGVASLLDVFPTLTDLCQVRYPRGDESARTGRSLVPQLVAGERPPADALREDRALLAEVSMGPATLRSIRRERWHYVAATLPVQSAEALYDFVSDPREGRDRLEREIQTAADLRAAMRQSFDALAHVALTGASRDIDAETAQWLRSLGYVGGK